MFQTKLMSQGKEENENNNKAKQKNQNKTKANMNQLKILQHKFRSQDSLSQFPSHTACYTKPGNYILANKNTASKLGQFVFYSVSICNELASK